jgi:hypothetical protein
MDGAREAPVGYVLAVSDGLTTVAEEELVEFKSRGGWGSRTDDADGGLGREVRDVAGYMLGDMTVFVCGISR